MQTKPHRRTGSGALVTLAAWLLCACHPSSIAPAEPARADPGAATFAATCLGCHDSPGPSRPNFSVAMTHEAATQALSAVIERDMPPPTEDAPTEADRAHLIDWLCRTSGRNEASCTRLVRWELAPPLVRRGPTLVASIAHIVGAPVPSKSAHGLAMAALPKANRTILNATMVAALLVAATAACNAKLAPAASQTPPGAQVTPDVALSPAASEQRARCVEEVLRRTVAPPAEVVPEGMKPEPRGPTPATPSHARGGRS